MEREGLCCCEGMGRKEGGILLLLLRGHCFKSILIMINLIMIRDTISALVSLVN